MMKDESANNNEQIKFQESAKKVCDLTYITEMMDGKKHLIKGIMDTFLTQIPEELHRIEEAITKTDYAIIKSLAHSMKSSVSIMGILTAIPILEEIENLGKKGIEIGKIEELNSKINLICQRAIAEIEKEINNYA